MGKIVTVGWWWVGRRGKPPGNWRSGASLCGCTRCDRYALPPAHVTDRLAELVCSNSMGSTLPDRALGILKNEMLRLGSFVIRTAFKHALPAGQALAVGREEFAEEITARIAAHPADRTDPRRGDGHS